MLTIQGYLRSAVVQRLLPASGSVLEIGCGQGALGVILARHHEYLGLEPDAQSFAAAHAVLGDHVLHMADTELAPAEFDVVCAFEVLEHLEDDRAAIERWAAHVRPGGCMLVSVPAHPRLFGATDRRVGHFRRYAPDDLRELLESAGLSDVEIRSYAFPIGYLLLLMGRMLAGRSRGSMEQRTYSSGRWLQPSARTAFARRALASPFVVVQRPFERTMWGTGFVACARRDTARPYAGSGVRRTRD